VLFAPADLVAAFFEFGAAGMAGDDASSSSSSTPIASRPALVIFRAKRPSSFSCQTGASALARISRARPLPMSDEATFWAAAA
jgi:hypothetical protein